MKRDMKLKCGCQQQEYVDERSRFVLCVCERKIGVRCDYVCTCTSLCVDEYACVCVHAGKDALSQLRLITP